MVRTAGVHSLVLAAPFTVLLAAIGGCGLSVPEKDFLAPDTINSNNISSGGKYENALVIHILCETARGLKMAYENVRAPEQSKQVQLAWLRNWGTAITLAITVGEQSALSPGVSLTTPFENKIFTFPTGGNVTAPQSFVLGMGGSATANATRTETIQFTYANVGLLEIAEGFPDAEACRTAPGGVMIDGDLKIWEFIYDKAVIAAAGNASTYVPILVRNGFKMVKDKKVPQFKMEGYTQHPSWPLYNTFTENISFTATFGGNATPTWKLARVSANPSGNLLSATHTNTNQLTITMGPLQAPASATAPAQLKSGAQTQHDNTVLSNQIKGP